MVERGPPAYAGSTGARVGRGIVAGVPDLFVLHRGIAHMVEVKTPAGELSDPQQSVMAAVLASGGQVGVVRNARPASISERRIRCLLDASALVCVKGQYSRKDGCRKQLSEQCLEHG